ncbi:ervatamin-B-like [Protopterus annectens]|uniref:ervatamin-B-like n=1 Tax=Protopterus annectens TaxID=7888 RepID=UPI001CFBF6F1|nr:ervatamin-B-like [Protopterus annectens]
MHNPRLFDNIVKGQAMRLSRLCCEDSTFNNELEELKQEKKYSTLEEEQFRRLIWEDTWKKVSEHNMLAEQGEKSYWKETNYFADMTSKELSSYTCTPMELFHKSCSGEPVIQVLPHAKNIDWKKKKCVTPAKNQTSSCHSCWIFSVVAAIESRYCIRHKQLYNLSEQQVMDCGGFKNPCKPHYLEEAIDYIKKAKGLMKKEDYPYIGHKSPNELCLFYKRKSVQIKNLQCKRITREEDMATAVEKRGPITFAMKIPPDFYQFSGNGIFDDLHCCMYNHSIHAMTIVGFGQEEGVDYWLIKNSWGRKWGSAGFAKIRRNVRLCGIGEYVLELDFQ